MTTTTRVPLEPFLPLASLESDVTYPRPVTSSTLSSQVSSALCPLALSRGEAGCFDHLSATSRLTSPYPALKTNGVNVPSLPSNIKGFSPSSPPLRGPPPAQPAHFLLPNLAPVRETNFHLQQLRSSSLSPNHRRVTLARESFRGEPLESVAASRYSSPVDPANEYSSAHTIHRLLQQNARIRGAWEAERKYLEANRERAEEVYKEERVIMEEDRLAWDDERAQLLQQVEALGRERVGWDSEKSRLLQQIERLQIKVSALESRLDGYVATSERGLASRIPTRDHSASNDAVGGGDASHEGRGSTFHPLMNASNMNSGPAQSNVGSLKTGKLSSSDQATSQSNLSSMATVIPGPLSPPSNAMGLSGTENGHVPVVDVREIHPELEGIPIKANAIQRPTFTDGPTPIGSRITSRTGSPTENQRSPLDKQESRQQTLETLAAPETARLTMHAGHTPSHSMSVVPTSVPSAVSTAASSGGCTTPLACQDHMTPLKSGAADEDDRRDSSVSMSEPAEPVEPAPSQQAQVGSTDDSPDPLMDPDSREDRTLAAPLMIRNIPATDEIFLRRLSDKLEEMRRSPEIAIPAVLKDPVPDGGSPEEFMLPSPPAAAGAVAEAAETTRSRHRSPKNDEELEIPLRIKKSSNFGAPFGERR